MVALWHLNNWMNLKLNEFETTTTNHGLQQLIDEPTHLRKIINSASSIDLIHKSTKKSQIFLSTVDSTLVFKPSVNTKLSLLMRVLELNTIHLINTMSGIKQKLTLTVNLISKNLLRV